MTLVEDEISAPIYCIRRRHLTFAITVKNSLEPGSSPTRCPSLRFEGVHWTISVISCVLLRSMRHGEKLESLLNFRWRLIDSAPTGIDDSVEGNRSLASKSRPKWNVLGHGMLVALGKLMVYEMTVAGIRLFQTKLQRVFSWRTPSDIYHGEVRIAMLVGRSLLN